MNTIFCLQPIEYTGELRGAFYVIENFPYPQFVLNEDGNTRSFDSYNAALGEANECQEGYVIKI